MTNIEVMNEVIAFNRDMNGMLTFMGSYPTYGKVLVQRKSLLPKDGIDPLASQGSLIYPVMAVSYLQLTQAAIVSVVSS
jgi:6-phosphogluconolactonase